GGGRDAVLAGAGLRDDPRLAHALGEQHLAERVVHLVRAGVVQVLALQVDLKPGRLGQAPGRVQRARPPHPVAQEMLELELEAGVRAGRDPGLLELVERRDQGLRHVPAPVGAEALVHRGQTAALGTAASACSTARKKASSFAGSLRPGAASVPLALSTANGCTAAIPCPTLPAVRPPERTIGTWRSCASTRSHWNVSPVPPRWPGT